ncbi:MAG TPA: serine--tRNA ligase, partial [Erysipelotrichaceae bacterium]|nr:serine--tRNA ligase [Erysipelotrichaceae bacterium]
MIDIARLREDPESVRENIRKKFQDHKLPLVDEALKLDQAKRASETEGSELRAEKNKISKSIGQLMREGKKEEAEAAKARVKEINEKLPELEAT